MLFADDATLEAHYEDLLQSLKIIFSKACEAQLNNRLLEDIMRISSETPLNNAIKDNKREIVNTFTYLGSIVTGDL